METHLTPFANDVITDVQDHSVDRVEVVSLITLRRRLELVRAKRSNYGGGMQQRQM